MSTDNGMREEPQQQPEETSPIIELVPGSDDYEDIEHKEYTADDFALDDDEDIDAYMLDLDLDFENSDHDL